MSVSAIIVTYNSNIEKLTEIVTSLNSELSYYIVDNSIDEISRTAISSLCLKLSLHYLPMQGNVGIASAQNMGIEKAISLGATDILFLDDDSVPDPSMLENLLKARQACLEKSSKIPILCANALHNGDESLNVLGEEVINGVYKCRDLISSGTFVNATHIEIVGLLEDELFIDCVDFEWGWRAQSLGYEIYLVKNAILRHRLGDGRANYIPIKYPSPIRHYYQYRNILSMLTRSYVPIAWKVSQSLRLPIKFILIFLVLDNKFKRSRYAIRGVYDFLRRKSGAI